MSGMKDGSGRRGLIVPNPTERLTPAIDPADTVVFDFIPEGHGVVTNTSMSHSPPLIAMNLFQ